MQMFRPALRQQQNPVLSQLSSRSKVAEEFREQCLSLVFLLLFHSIAKVSRVKLLARFKIHSIQLSV
jgi:hypothetical protein